MNPPPPQPPQPPPSPLPPANTLLTLSVSCQTDATTHRALAQLAATGPSPVSHPWPVLDMVVGDRGFVVGVVSFFFLVDGGAAVFLFAEPACPPTPPTFPPLQPLLHRFTVVDVINITSIVPPNPATITVEQHYGWLSAAPPALKKALTTPAAVDALAASIDRLRQLGLVLAVPIAFPDGGDVIGVRREVRVSWADGRAYASAVIDAAGRYNGVAFAVFLDALGDGGVQIASGAVAATQSNQPPAGEAADTAAVMSADSLRAAFVSLRGAIIVALRDGVGPRLRCIGEAGRGAARLPGGNAVAATGPAFPTTHLDACAAFTPPTTPDAPRPARPPSPPCTPSTSVVDLGTLPATFYLPAAIPADDPRSAVASQLYAAPPAPRSPSLASIMKANGLHPDINTRLCMMHSVLAYAAFGRAVAGECVRPEAGASRSPCDAVVSMTDALSLSVTDVLRVAVVSMLDGWWL